MTAVVVAREGSLLFFGLFGSPSIAFVLGGALCLLVAARAVRRQVGGPWVTVPRALAVFWALFAPLWEIINVFLI